MVAQRYNSPRVDMPLQSDTLSWFRANHLLLLDLKAACLAVKHQMQLLQCLVWPGLELTIYDTRGKHACLVWPGLELTIYDTRGKHACLVWPGLELTIYDTRGKHAYLVWPGLELTIYDTRGKHATHYTSYAVDFFFGNLYRHKYIVCLMMFNATFNNISVISWRSVLLVEETRGPGENHRPVASHWQTLSHNVVHLALI